MSDVRTLIDEYTSITGRNVATLGVSEYLEFRKYIDTTNIVTEDKQITPVQKKNPAPKEDLSAQNHPEENVPLISERRTKKEPSVIEKKTASIVEDKKVLQQEEQKDSNIISPALMMLRSIEG